MPIRVSMDINGFFSDIKNKLSPEKRERVEKVIDDTKEVVAEKTEKMKAVGREVVDVVQAAKEVIIEDEFDPSEEIKKLIEALEEFQNEFEKIVEEEKPVEDEKPAE